MSLKSWLATLLSQGSCFRQNDPVASTSASTAPRSNVFINIAREPVVASAFSAANVYAEEFGAAWQFSAKNYPETNMRVPEERNLNLRQIFVQHALKCLTNEVFAEMQKQVDPVYAYGTQCANVHLHVMRGLRLCFPLESFHLTLGGVITFHGAEFPYTMADFQADMVKRPDRVRGHVWITCGDRFIIDLTLGTYLVNKPDATGHYGHAIYGEIGGLMSAEFKGGRPSSLALTYHPVAVGIDPILATAPSYSEWAGA